MKKILYQSNLYFVLLIQVFTQLILKYFPIYNFIYVCIFYFNNDY